MTDDLIGTYAELPFPPAREVGIDTVRIGMKRHHIPVLAEVDVTAARAAIANRKAQTGEGLSFTGWVIKCLAQAASEHKRAHALRLGRHKLVLFDDVDVAIVVQRRLEGTEPPEYLPMPYVIRKANEKTVEAVHAEIRAAQARVLTPGEQTIDLAEKMPSPRTIRSFARMPFFVRRALYWNRLFHDPFRVKRTMGTVSVTSVGMFGKVSGGSSWGIPVEFHPLTVALGAISQKPAVVGDRVEAREFLGMTVVFDHDVVDGAPGAMFLQRLRKLMRVGFVCSQRCLLRFNLRTSPHDSLFSNKRPLARIWAPQRTLDEHRPGLAQRVVRLRTLHLKRPQPFQGEPDADAHLLVAAHGGRCPSATVVCIPRPCVPGGQGTKSRPSHIRKIQACRKASRCSEGYCLGRWKDFYEKFLDVDVPPFVGSVHIGFETLIPLSGHERPNAFPAWERLAIWKWRGSENVLSAQTAHVNTDLCLRKLVRARIHGCRIEGGPTLNLFLTDYTSGGEGFQTRIEEQLAEGFPIGGLPPALVESDAEHAKHSG